MRAILRKNGSHVPSLLLLLLHTHTSMRADDACGNAVHSFGWHAPNATKTRAYELSFLNRHNNQPVLWLFLWILPKFIVISWNGVRSSSNGGPSVARGESVTDFCRTVFASNCIVARLGPFIIIIIHYRNNNGQTNRALRFQKRTDDDFDEQIQ
jgi:hypothetical protein